MNAPQSDAPGSPPALSPAIEQQLSAALKAHAVRPSDETTASLRSAIAAAAIDARRHGLQSQELIIVFKSIEMQAGRIAEGDGRSPESRNQLVRALLDAYYMAETSA
jgi:hypothetical protein